MSANCLEKHRRTSMCRMNLQQTSCLLLLKVIYHLGKLYGGGVVATLSIVFLGIFWKSIFKRQKNLSPLFFSRFEFWFVCAHHGRLIFIGSVFALSATSFLLPEKKGCKETGHRIAFLPKR